MKSPRIILLAFALALIVPACAEVHWHKPGGDAAALPNDLASCRIAAHHSIERRLGPPVPSATDPRFGADMTLPSPAERRMQERMAEDQCMRDKGYTLVPAEK